jgi:NTF2 fold immunity protein
MSARFLFVTAALSVVAAVAHSSTPPKDGYVPDADTAVKIAVVVWSRVYGEREIAAQKPYRAKLKDGVWTVQGSLPENEHGAPQFVGGVAYAEIAQKDGCILAIGHGE